MLGKLKAAIMFVLDPPGEPEGPDPLTLAVPDAQSTFKRGSVGWANRPPAKVKCPSCGSTFVHQYAANIINCPTCRFELAPDRFDEIDLIEMRCPECESVLDHGIRHPNVFDSPQWAACPNCQYHWEYLHFSRAHR